MQRKPSAADAIRRQLARSKSKPAEATPDDPFSQVILGLFASRGLTAEPEATETDEDRFGRALDAHLQQQAATTPPQKSKPAPIPLNGAAILRAAIAGSGGPGTISGSW
ncbi:hypothetical protein MMUR_47780 [Mycolicibacterium murale]|uniref:Uncharacterized protein n=1 Tax=Mycolicibacterium murale TaxID=182220 RepID=A0A7I9WSC7_9MYCO|nr:hypothetical protein [Mycolicibacterium murale]MCV7186402.1 hypothetical protein [Mycolicibacterium murale]GFG60642.1 hypothetical protein MMUR_47780 [Mycolicibacterium murale]